ncbi:unnamed protein product [Adineta steineri]|uniref:Uncharacterized protein n=1 Tax=Adineta steineri TaxID=433720 RepID=A0A814QFT4_9BILA|nr:unnamed protein product [Adineta steineri]CAF3862497.1 unnamed protein product [Adineta steineri]
MPFVMYNPTGGNVTITTANGTRFSFDSLRFTSAWVNSLNVTMKTNRSGSVTSIVTLRALTTTKITDSYGFCTNIDTITFEIVSGITGSDLTQNGTQFIIDNLCISFGH